MARRILEKLSSKLYSISKKKEAHDSWCHLLGAINNIDDNYQSQGFTIKEIKADLEFHCLREDLRPITIDI